MNRKSFLQTSASSALGYSGLALGGGEMPSFSSVLKGNEGEIIAYLFNKKNKNLTQKVSHVNNETKRDTLTRYQNITAYRSFKDAKDRPAIKPPWGTLNAINMSTGKYP